MSATSSRRIIGIDPGYDRLGLAVIEGEVGRETLLTSQCIITQREMPFFARLGEAVRAVVDVIDSYQPSALALEQLFFSTNQKTAFKVAEVRGALLYIAHTRALALHEYTPGQIKLAITGDGASGKARVRRMLLQLLVNAPKKALDDEYDAIAVALTCSASTRDI